MVNHANTLRSQNRTHLIFGSFSVVESKTDEAEVLSTTVKVDEVVIVAVTGLTKMKDKVT